ncbi:MAG: hypothetical protein HFF17_00575 [Oscillospiraceae bacterium]|nr:hypothetical protein [Oscillospiraceae bacterium]
MAKRTRERTAARQAAVPEEKSVLIPILLWLLALVGFFNLLMGAYLYTAYQNHQNAARSGQTETQTQAGSL